MPALELSKQAAAAAPGGRAQYNVATIALSVGHVDEAVKTLLGMDPGSRRDEGLVAVLVRADARAAPRRRLQCELKDDRRVASPISGQSRGVGA